MFISKNPTAIIFYLKHNNAGFRSNGNINLGICAVRFLQVQIMKYRFGIDTCFQQFQNQSSFRPFSTKNRRDLLNEFTLFTLNIDKANDTDRKTNQENDGS